MLKASMEPDQKEFVAGQRFRLTKLGRERCPKLAAKMGIIVRVRDSTASIIVRFDGNKHATTIHKNYIEPA